MREDESAFSWLNVKIKNGCNHVWEYIGHGHNYSCYRCIICREEGEY